jgi:hypothetical protein
MKLPPSRAHQTMLAFDRISNIAGGNPPGGPRVKAVSRFPFRVPWAPPPERSEPLPVLSIDKEFRKIPFDRPGSHNYFGFAFEKPVKRMSPVPLTSCRTWEMSHYTCYTCANKIARFGSIARFLAAELITRKA